LNFPSCDRKVSSGITRPFGRLSQSPGYVSDALLTRPPLNRGRSPDPVRLACLSHAASVQAEPGSNSSIGISRHDPLPPPDVISGLTVSQAAVILETSLSTPHRSRLIDEAVTASSPAGAEGQSDPQTPRHSRQAPESEQGSNIHFWLLQYHSRGYYTRGAIRSCSTRN
jgi:hypothetical protein